MLKTTALAAFVAATVALFAGSSVAQSVPVEKVGDDLAFSALGHTLRFPQPNWLTAQELAAADPLAQLESRSNDDGKSARVEFVPKGQKFDDWVNHVTAELALTPDRTLGNLREDLILELSQTCQSSRTGFFQFGQDNPEAPPVLGFACGAYIDTIPGLAGKGGIALIAFKRSDKGLASVVEEWRGPAFDPALPTTWPVPTATVEERAALLQSTAALEATE